jgi:hypothetical protein
MVAQTPPLAGTATLPGRGTLPLTRVLGTIGMVTSPFFLLGFAVDGFKQGDASPLGAMLGLVFTIGWFSSAVGLCALRAAGNRFGRVLLGLEIVGTVLASIFQVYEAVAPGSDSIFYMITDIAWPLSMLVLLISGIACIRARVLPGFLRFAPNIAALWLPVSIAALGVLGTTGGLIFAGIHVTLGWFLMGLAVFRAGRQ